MNSQLQDMNWYVVYTRPKTERKVAENITDMGIESYLPMYKVVRQWSDRKQRIDMPLFPNYVFVRVNSLMRTHLFSIKELVRFVSIEQKPVVIREKEIMTIKRVLTGDADVMPEEYFQEGMRVKIGYGPLAGLEGVILQRSGTTRLIVRIDALMKAFSVSVPTNHAEIIREARQVDVG